MPGSDFRDSSTLQCKGSGCVDYTERTIQNCDSCYRAWRICRYQDLQLVKSVLESLQHELERPWKLSEEDETDPDPKKARQARRNRLLKADTAIALQIVKRQARGLQNQVRAEQFIAERRRELEHELGIVALGRPVSQQSEPQARPTIIDVLTERGVISREALSTNSTSSGTR
ncbi:MAG: hypothetical protein HETSPECPRED_005980 [Heterodermia speciosa]|uniref:Uncharacterized protein n=1 Tax=Heterodermia speciosa TaxID=116794 RepID=A0A8H3IA26_9LECA|nr:MAG: hypothetical protein HETSPECPRED_005980 [Heterodermia speciosa]